MWIPMAKFTFPIYMNGNTLLKYVCLPIYIFVCKMMVFFLTNIYPISFFASLSFLCVEDDLNVGLLYNLKYIFLYLCVNSIKLKFCLIVSTLKMKRRKIRNRVCLDPGKPGKLWNFILTFSRIVKSWKRLQALEIPGNLLNSSNKVYRIFAVRNEWKPWGKLILKS